MMKDGRDVTDNYKRGALEALELCRIYNIRTAILKERSPSCGKGKIYDGTYTKTLKDGNGICADLLVKNNITVLTEREIDKI